MTTFRMNLEVIQPSQLYISRRKFERILEAFDKNEAHKIPPVPIKEIDGEMVSTDGHTRALVWHMKGHATAAKNLYSLEHFVGGYNILLRTE